MRHRAGERVVLAGWVFPVVLCSELLAWSGGSVGTVAERQAGHSVQVVGQDCPALPDPGALGALEPGPARPVVAFEVGDASLAADPEPGPAPAGPPRPGVAWVAGDEHLGTS